MKNLLDNFKIPLNLESSKLKQSLMTLNNDCLFELFTYSVNIEDLVELGSACSRFLSIAQQAFCSKFKKSNHFGQMTNWPIEKVERYLQHFGEFCETFDSGVLRGYDQAQVLLLLTKYCENLKNVRCYESGRIASSLLKSLFSKVVQLENHLGKFNGMQLFDKNSPLQKLSLIDCEADLPEQNLPHLQHVKLELTRVDKPNLANFFCSNKQLIRLELWEGRYSLEYVIQHLENLEELTYSIQGWCKSFEGFENLKKLKKLTLTANGHERYMFVTYSHFICGILNALHRANAPLEFIMLDEYIDYTAIFQAIAQYNTIKEVVFKQKSYFGQFQIADRLIHLIDRMPQLEHITCDSTTFTMETIRTMLGDSEALKSAFSQSYATCDRVQ